MKKVVYLMEYPIDLAGGGQMSTQTLCEGLIAAKADWEPIVICPKLLKRKAEDYPFRVLEYKALENREDAMLPRLLNLTGRMRYFIRLIEEERPDLIHVSMSESLLTYGFVRWLPKLRKYPFIYTDRGLCYGYRKHTKFLMRRILKRSKGMICTTQFNRSLWLKEELPINITVIPNTISRVFSVYETGKRESMRERFGLAKEDLVIGFAGRISEEKDWDLVPVLVKALKDADVDFKVALVISVYEKQDLAIAEGIKQRIVKSIGEEKLIYMQDLSQSEISDYYYMVDVFVMSSMFESFGKAAVEAMSRRCSVVSTTAGGLKEVVGKDENLYTRKELSRFTDRIKKLSSDRKELEADRDYFYERYKENYTLDTHVKKHISLYDSVTAG